MDQTKIGTFISKKRKERNLTQEKLAEKLGITDRAVSKWETGKSLPDASIMLDLCRILGITVNDLLSGEELSMERINERTEKNLIEMVRQKEAADRRLLKTEIVIVALSMLFLASMIVIAALIPMENWIKYLLMGIGLLQLIAVAAFAFRIEQKAGYYECAECGHRYVPSYAAVFFSPHMNRTKYMKCPKCGKKSWQKKVIGAEEAES